MAGVWDSNLMQYCDNPGCLAWFKSQAPESALRESMFVYKHLRTNTFMLARWLREWHVFYPVMEIGETPVLNDAVVAKFRSIFYPEAAQTAEVALKQASDNQRRDTEDFHAERREIRAKVLRDAHGIRVRHEDGRVFAPAGLLGG